MKKVWGILLLATLAGCNTTNRSDEPAVKNLIYMIGDGMGLGHVSYLMLEEGYQETAFDRMENVALCSTYSANNRVTDSAAGGTALATGHKTNNSMLGTTPEGECVESMLAKAVAQNRPAGFVVTCEVQHATPAAFYAHVTHRSDYATISQQLTSSGLDLAFGGGRSEMNTPDSLGVTPLQKMREAGYGVAEQLSEVTAESTLPLVGLFAEGHMPSKLEGRDDYLPQAVEKALGLLNREAEARGTGFVMMIEGSQIDFESHARRTEGILAETRDFELAVAAAQRFVDSHPGTLLVVTADHETSGLTLPSGNSDFTASESGVLPSCSSGSHTATLVPIYLYGAGADSVRGVLDNTELSNKLMEILQL